MTSTALAVTQPLEVRLVGRYSTGIFSADGGAAEIVAHDPATQQLYVVNAVQRRIDILTIANPASPALVASIDVTPYGGNVNSVAVKNGVLAAAIEAATKTSDGSVVLFDTAGVFQKQVAAGALPDMLTFTPDGMRILVANEGEPNSYGQADSIDPVGSITIVDLTGGVVAATSSQVHFSDFNVGGPRHGELPASVRIFGPGASVAQDLEPEYIAVSPDGSKAYVALQENNAFALINLPSGTIDKIVGLGFKDHSLPGNGLDASDRDGPGNDPNPGNIQNWPVFGMYQPDGIATFMHNGQTFVISANEGDAREYVGFEEEVRVGAGSVVLDPTVFPDATIKTSNDKLNRLTITNTLGRTTADGQGTDANTDYEKLFAFGARSFSIWDANGVLVYDSGDMLEQIVKSLDIHRFNSTHDAQPSADTRSDNKGPEPESVSVVEINGARYAFIGLERQGGFMIFDISDPLAPSFVDYINARDFAQTFTAGTITPAILEAVGDLGPEGLLYIPPADSPTGFGLFVTANEISGTTTIFQVTPIPEPGMLTLLAGAAMGLLARRRRLA
jgi:DNA-binding beta-propeller fold protein YncE